jgi:hypothetical protein
MLGSSMGGHVVSVHDPLENCEEVIVVSVCSATLPAAMYCLSSLWYRGVIDPPPRASLIFSRRSDYDQQEFTYCIKERHVWFLTFISIGRPEGCLLKVTELSHPVQIHVEGFDSKSTPDQVEYLCRSMLACHYCQLSGSQTTTHDDYIYVFLLSQLGCHGRIRELSNLHGMATCLSNFSESGGDRWCIARSNCKHNAASKVRAFIRADREYLLDFRDPRNHTEIDVFDSLLLYEISP